MLRYSALMVLVFAVACASSSNTSTDNGTHDPGVQHDTAVDVPPEIKGDIHVDDPGQALADTGKTDTGIPFDTGSDVGNGCPSQAITGSTCAEVGACLLACDVSGFQAQCKAGSQTQAVADFQAIVDCSDQAKCGHIFAGERFTQCILDHCETPYNKCFVNAGSKASSCQDIRDCRMNCPAGDPTCPVKCIAKGSASAQKDYFKYAECLFSLDCVKVLGQVGPNGWPQNSCELHAWGMNCGKYWDACKNPM